MITLFIDNSKSNNKIVNTLGNSVTYYYKPSIVLNDKKKYEIRLVSMSIVYCSPNITSSNNKLVYTTNDGITHTYYFEIGLYTLKDINMQISLYTMGSTHGNDANLITFVPDQSTSKLYVYFSSSHTSIDCTTSTIMQILGFPTSMGVIGDFSYSSGSEKSTQRAYLNPIQSFLVQTNITTGNYLGSDSSSVIASVPINVQPQSTVVYSPVHPIRTIINNKKIEQLTVTILDQFGNPVDIGSNGGDNEAEDWSCVLSITELTDTAL